VFAANGAYVLLLRLADRLGLAANRAPD